MLKIHSVLRIQHLVVFSDRIVTCRDINSRPLTLPSLIYLLYSTGLVRVRASYGDT